MGLRSLIDISVTWVPSCFIVVAHGNICSSDRPADNGQPRAPSPGVRPLHRLRALAKRPGDPYANQAVRNVRTYLQR